MEAEIMDRDIDVRTVTDDLDSKISKEEKNMNIYGMNLYFQNKHYVNCQSNFHIQKRNYRIFSRELILKKRFTHLEPSI